jgi:hypothetical protein
MSLTTTTNIEKCPKTDRTTYMREYKRRKYAEDATAIKEINKKSYYKNKYNRNTEDWLKYADHYPAVCRIKNDLDKIPLDVVLCILTDYNIKNGIVI